MRTVVTLPFCSTPSGSKDNFKDDINCSWGLQIHNYNTYYVDILYGKRYSKKIVLDTKKLIHVSFKPCK